MARREALDVRPGTERWLDLVVGHRREAAVARRRERREDVEPTEQAIQRAIEETFQGREIAAQGVGVGHQLGRDSHSVPFSVAGTANQSRGTIERRRSQGSARAAPRRGSSAVQPFSEPWSRAEMNWRWKSRKTISVGRQDQQRPGAQQRDVVPYWPWNAPSAPAIVRCSGSSTSTSASRNWFQVQRNSRMARDEIGRAWRAARGCARRAARCSRRRRARPRRARAAC